MYVNVKILTGQKLHDMKHSKASNRFLNDNFKMHIKDKDTSKIEVLFAKGIIQTTPQICLQKSYPVGHTL